MPLSQQRLGEVIRPARLCSLHLNQSGAQSIASRLRFTALHALVSVLQSVRNFFFVAWIAAQQKVVEVQPIEHDLIANEFNRAHALQRHGGFFARRTLLQSGDQIHNQQKHQDREYRPEPQIKFLTDRHRQKPPLPCHMPTRLGGPCPAQLATLNSNSTTCVVSSGADANFHSFTASMQDCTRSGCPPSARVLFTRPSGVMITSILTFPETLMRLASSG